MKTQRGAVFIVSLVLLGVLMSIMIGFSSRFTVNNMGIEREIASARALELAQGECMLVFDKVWTKFLSLQENPDYPTPQDRVVWLGVTSADTNKNKKRDGYIDKDGNFIGEDPPAIEGYSSDWQVFGQGEVKTTCAVYSISEDNSYVNLKFETTARVASDSLVRTGTPEEKSRWMYRKVQQIVRVGFGFTQQSKTFDFAYFVNNYGWMYAGGNVIRIYGNVGSNGDLGFQGSVIVDGDLFAAYNPAIGAAGTVNGEGAIYRDTLPVYRAGGGLPASDQILMQPGNPGYTEDVNGNGKLDAGEDKNLNGKIDSQEYPPGYDAKPLRNPNDLANQAIKDKQQPLDMPYIGDLSLIKEKAIACNSKIEQLRKGGNPAVPADWETVVNNIYGVTDGENGIYSTYNATTKTVTRTAITKVLAPATGDQWRNGNIALIGTPEQPLRVTGPVVITNDLVIKGTISGKGTIYTGRNLHIVGDMVYKDPPSWKLNDPNFNNQITANASKDMVGFAVKGSIIMGQYYRMKRSDIPPQSGKYDDSDGWGTTRYYFHTGFQDGKLQAYKADPTDDVIGYYDSKSKSFHGDYTLPDGGQRFNKDDFSTKTARRYYESSFPDDYIQSICTARPAIMQGIFYTNHLIGGRPQDVRIMGSIVARDEGIVFNNFLRLFYDPRSASSGDTASRAYLPSVRLPGGPASYNVWLWQEMAEAQQ